MPPDKEFCDLHIHSTYSDSDATVESIFQAAKEKRLRAIAITDHDTMDGMEEALRCSREYGIEIIKGLELSTEHEDIEVHILGYFGDHVASDFLAGLVDIKRLRTERLTAMADKLNGIGIKVDNAELFDSIKDNIPTRLHLALYLKAKGYVVSLVEAFKRFLAPGKPGYVSRFRYSVHDAIAAINNAGGIAFLAHPHYLPKKEWIDQFASWGLSGIEVVYPRLSAATIAKAADNACRLGLLKSGGSDAHGSYKDFTSVGGVEVPYEFAQAIKERIHQKSNA